MDWNLIFDILKSISIIIASGVAIYGINSWRRETKWKRKYELAEETLSLFYEIQDILSIIRSPFGNEEEGKTRKRSENESKKDSIILDQAYTVIERFNKNKEPFLKLKAIKYRFITLFGKESEKHFNDVMRLTNLIMNVSNSLGRIYWKDQGRKDFTDAQSEQHLKTMHEYEEIIWESGDGDEVKKEIENIISKIEKICSSILKSK